SLEATAFSQTRASSARSGSAAQGQAARKSQALAPTKALTTMRRAVGPATTDNWTCANGTVDQNWSDPMNWGHGVPTAGSDVSIPSAGSTCAVNLNGSGNVNNLGILPGGEVIVGGGGSLTINGASITNDGGQLFLNSSSTGSATAELLIVGSVTLSGNGRLVMSASSNNHIRGGGSLFNQSTIEGAGSVGYLELTLNNYGTINANATEVLSVSHIG